MTRNGIVEKCHFVRDNQSPPGYTVRAHIAHVTNIVKHGEPFIVHTEKFWNGGENLGIHSKDERCHNSKKEGFNYADGRIDFARWKFKPKFASPNLQALSCKQFALKLTGINSMSVIHLRICEFWFEF